MYSTFLERIGFIAAICLAVSFASFAATDDLDGIDYPAVFCDKMLAIKTPQNFSWAYFDGLVMEGMFRVWQRTGKESYYDFVKQWLDRFVTDTGLTTTGYRTNLDAIHNGFALCHMYETSGEAKYKTCAKKIFDILPSYRRTTDGTPVHNISADELWLDGCWMLGHFLTNYGREIGNKAFCDSMTAAHAISMHNHCFDQAGQLPIHAWDENGSTSWANTTTHKSSQKWCRAIGWLVMDIADVLVEISSDDPRRQTLIEIQTTYLRTLKTLQDSVTGLWFQVVDKPRADSNWIEQSSACMYSYAMAKGVESGYLDADEFDRTIKKAYQGIMGNILLNESGYPDIYGTCVGTGVGSYSYYINRTQPKNDPHGTGAWLIACEYLRTRFPGEKQRIYQAESATFEGNVESEHRGFGGSGYVNTPNAVGAAVVWTVNLDRAVKCQLTFRYGNGGGNSRPVVIKVNGVAVGQNLDCPAGKWNRWDATGVSVDLQKGENTIRMEAVSAEGCPNVDLLAVDQADVVTALPDMNQPMRRVHGETRLVATGRFTVPAWAVGTSTIAVYDLRGMLVYRGAVTGSTVDLSAMNKSSTMYVVRITRNGFKQEFGK